MTPKVVHATLEGAGWVVHKESTALTTEGWIPNDPDYTPFADCPVHLQIFPEDNHWPPEEIEDRLHDCVAHARAKGFLYVLALYQAWRADPDWYDRSGTYGLYALEDAWNSPEGLKGWC